MNRKYEKLKFLVAAVLLAGSQMALADTNDNTDAGTDITNQATVNYMVGTVAQTPVDSNIVTFVVDREILVTVANLSDASVSPGATDQMLSYTVTNDSNDTLDFVLGTANAGGDFDATGLSIFVESGANNGYQVAEDTATSIDDLAEEGIATVYVVGDIPGAATDGQTDAVILTATAYETDGTTIVVETNVGVADDPNVVDTVFGDGDGDGAEGSQDGAHSATATYTVASATIAVNKSSTVISDPFNGVSASAKAIPGAVVEYCIAIANTGGTAASNVVVSDPILANITYVPGSIIAGGSDCAGTGGTSVTDAVDAEGPPSGDFTGNTVNTTVSSVPASSTVTTIFRVTID